MRQIVPVLLALTVVGSSVARAEKPAAKPFPAPAQAAEPAQVARIEPANPAAAALLNGACSLTGEGLAEKIAQTLSQNPDVAAETARLARSCSCEQAASIAQGVVRAMKKLQEKSDDAVKPVYRSLVMSCVSCSPGANPGRTKPAPTGADQAAPDQSAPDQSALDQANAIRAPAEKLNTEPGLLNHLLDAAKAQPPAPTGAADGQWNAVSNASGPPPQTEKLPLNAERCEKPVDKNARPQADALKVRAPQSADCFCAAVSSLAAQAFAGDDIAGDRFGFYPDEGAFGGGGAGGDSRSVTSN